MIKVSVMYANTRLRLSEGLWRKFLEGTQNRG